MKNRIDIEFFNDFTDDYYETEFKNTINKLLEINNNLDLKVQPTRDSQNIPLTYSNIGFSGNKKEFLFMDKDKNL